MSKTDLSKGYNGFYGIDMEFKFTGSRLSPSVVQVKDVKKAGEQIDKPSEAGIK
jgi:hypothetical protein